MAELSGKAQELLKFLQDEYVDNGYLYSGSWPYESLKERGFSKEVIGELREAQLVQRRDCDDYAFELTAPERKRLMNEHSLTSAWAKAAGPGLADAIAEEINSAYFGPAIGENIDWGNEEQVKARELLEKYTYLDMTTPELKLVEEYEVEQLKPWVDKLLEHVSAEKVEERIHDMYLDFQIAEGTEMALYKYLEEKARGLSAVIENAYIQAGDGGSGKASEEVVLS